MVNLGFIFLQILSGLGPEAARADGSRELVVRMRAGQMGIQSLGALGAKSATSLAGSSTYLLELFEDQDIRSNIARLKKNPAIELVEENVTYNVFETGLGADPGSVRQWNLMADVGGVHATELWASGATGSRSVKVAVLDTGVDVTHPDLKENIAVLASADQGKAGCKGDVNGCSMLSKTGDVTDRNGHGTHCAGIIGAVGNNGIGISGVNWAVSIVPVAWMNERGQGKLSDAVAAIEYSRKRKVQVISASWGGPVDSQILKRSIQDAGKDGILFVAAAGNGDQSGIGVDNDKAPIYPAAYQLPNLISVAATDQKDQLARFSNFGLLTTTLAAPGVGILSTVPGGYSEADGTSMAAPHVAGAAALLLSISPTLKPNALIEVLKSNSDPIPGLKGKLQAGRLNIERAERAIRALTEREI